MGSLISAIDRYEVQKYLGRGQFSHVYLARDMHSKKDVVLKILRPSEIN